MQEILKDQIKYLDIFLLVIKGDFTRFDLSTQELLLWYEAVFGKDMWKHVTIATSFWGHTEAEALKRKRNRQVILK